MTLNGLLALALLFLFLYAAGSHAYRVWCQYREANLKRVEEARKKKEKVKEAEKAKERAYYDKIGEERERLGIDPGDRVRIKTSGHRACVKHVWHFMYKDSNEAGSHQLWRGHPCCTVRLFDLDGGKSTKGQFKDLEFLMHELELWPADSEPEKPSKSKKKASKKASKKSAKKPAEKATVSKKPKA